MRTSSRSSQARTAPFLRLVLAVAVVCATAGSATTRGQAPQGRPLFSEGAAADAPQGGSPIDRMKKRGRRVRANASVLLQADAPGGADVVTLNLFDDVQLRARRVRLDATRSGGLVWNGRLLDHPGHAIIAMHDGVMAGSIVAGDRVFEIVYAGDGTHEIVELDPSAFPTDDPPSDLPPIAPDPQADAVDAAVAAGLAGDAASQVDVMVVWSPAARAAAGGASAMQSLVDLAVAATNTAYANSSVTQRIRLVYAGEIGYTEAGISSDLSRLAATADGHMDAVHTLRNTYGADVVTLVGEGYVSGGVCGLGYLMSTVSTGFASNAFNVVDRVCTGSNLTFAHELGHNMGLHHDPANASGSPAFSYAYGYQQPSGAFRTVMAYMCPSGSCPRVLHFSNPAVTYNAMATGTDSQNNALALNNTASSVANFRQAVAAGCTYALGSSATSVGGGAATTTVSVVAGTGCAWTAVSNDAWITVTGGASGSGNGGVSLSIAANATSSSRTGTVTAAGQTFFVHQAGAPPVTASALTSSVALPAAAGTAITWTATASGGSSALLYQFWHYRESTGVWTMVRDYAASPSWAWATTTADAGTYAVQVWVKQTGSSAQRDAFRSSGYFSLTGSTPPPPPPSGPLAATAAAPAPLVAGSPLTWTIVTSGGVAPLQFKFWVYAASTGTWTVARDYGTGNALAYTPPSAGRYAFQAWVRNAGSTASYTVIVASGFVDVAPGSQVGPPTGPAPSGVLLSADRPAPFVAGTSITWTAATLGTAAPTEHKFWEYTDGAWRVLREYAAGNSVVWQPTAGTRAIQVWTRRVGSTLTREVYASSGFVTVLAP